MPATLGGRLTLLYGQTRPSAPRRRSGSPGIRPLASARPQAILKRSGGHACQGISMRTGNARYSADPGDSDEAVTRPRKSSGGIERDRHIGNLAHPADIGSSRSLAFAPEPSGRTSHARPPGPTCTRGRCGKPLRSTTTSRKCLDPAGRRRTGTRSTSGRIPVGQGLLQAAHPARRWT